MAMDGYSLADIKAVTDGGNGAEGGFGGGFMWIIVLFLFMFGKGGFGGNNGGEALTQSDLQRGFDTNTIVNKLDGITNGLCDGFYSQNTAMLQGFNGVGSSISNLGYQMQNCCCETQKEILASRYSAEKNTCDIVNAIRTDGEATRALINTNVMQELRDNLQSAQLALSNTNQTQNILNAMGRYVTNPPCPSNPCCGFVV